MHKNKFGNIGSLVGLLALGLALFQLLIVEPEQKPTIGERASEKVASLKSSLTSAFTDKSAITQEPNPSFSLHRALDFGVFGLGFMAICFGVVGFLRNESIRASGLAIGLGVSAVAFKFMIALAVLIIFVTLAGAFLGGFGI